MSMAERKKMESIARRSIFFCRDITMSSSDFRGNVYYTRLSKVRLWPLIAFIVLYMFIVVMQLATFYWGLFPSVVSSVEGVASRDVARIVASSFNRVVINFSVLVFMSFAVNIAFLYVVWSVKNFVDDMAK